MIQYNGADKMRRRIRRAVLVFVVMVATLLLEYNKCCHAFTYSKHPCHGNVAHPYLTSASTRKNTGSACDLSPVVFQKSPKTPLSLAKQENNNSLNKNNKPRDFKSPEDGSPLGVAIVVVGFVLLQLFGDRFDSAVVERYAAPVILCSASIAAGISRLIRNTNQND